MRRQKKFSLWIFPLLGIVVGIVYAYMFIHGLIVTWHFVGKPSENISRIIGFVDGNNLFVETETGNIYSLKYYNYSNGNDLLPIPIQWKREAKADIQPDPVRKPLMKFVSLPLLFKTKQIYEMQFPLVEGEYLVKFALANDGNLWAWNYGQGGMAVLTYFIFPAIGFFYGGSIAIVIKVGIFLWRKIRHN